MSESIDKNEKNERVEAENNISEYLEGIEIENAKDVAKKLVTTFENLCKDTLDRSLVDAFYQAITENDGKGFYSSTPFVNMTIKAIGQVIGEEQFISIDENPNGFSEVVDDLNIVQIYEEVSKICVGLERNRKRRTVLIENILLIFVYILNTYADKIDQYNEQQLNEVDYDYLGYCRKVLKSSKSISDMFMPVVWMNRQQEMFVIGDGTDVINADLDVKAFALNNDNVRLVGPAGEGKTWAMKYLQLQCCKEYLDTNGAKGSVIAVMVALKLFNDAKYKNKTISDLIMEELGITDTDLYEKIMDSGKVRVFLDGQNEIFYEDIKIHIIQFIDNHPLCRFVVSDRDTTVKPLRTFKKYMLRALDAEQIDWYFKKNLGEDFIRENGKIASLAWVKDEGVRVAPYMLEVLVSLAKEDIYPEKNDFDKEYLKYLLIREMTQKSIPKVHLLNKWLKKVANEMKSMGEDNYSLGQTEAENALRGIMTDQTDMAALNEFMIWANDIPLFGGSEYMQFKNRNYRDYYADDKMFNNTGEIIDDES